MSQRNVPNCFKRNVPYLPLHAATPVTLQVSASDLENDPIQYQILLDGQVLADWTSSASKPWTPSASQLGLHLFQVNVHDAYGGSTSQELEVFVVWPPVGHP